MSDGQEPVDLGPTPVRLPVREPSVFICVPPSAPCGSTCTPLQRRVVIATLISGHLLLSLLLPFFMYRPRTHEWLFAAALGICVSQVNLIAVWGALATGRLPEWLPWAILMGVLMWYALVLGNQLNSDLLISRTGAVELGLILLSENRGGDGPVMAGRPNVRLAINDSPAGKSDGRQRVSLESVQSRVHAGRNGGRGSVPRHDATGTAGR